MKYKTQDVEDDAKMSSALSDAFNDLLLAECDKLNLLISAKLYCVNNGYINHKLFIKEITQACTKFKFELENYLIGRKESLPEMSGKITEFDSIEKVFESLAEAEDDVYASMIDASKQALDDKDMCAFAFLLPAIRDAQKHILCIANEAVKNAQDPNKLLCGQHSTEN